MKTFSLCVAALVAAVTLTSVAAARPQSRHATDSARASSKIAFTRGSPTDGIYIMNADGSGKRLLARNASLGAWSPDGRKIAFSSKRDGTWDVYLMNADGSGQRRLTTDAANRDALTIQRDATQMLLDQSGRSNFSEVRWLEADLARIDALLAAQ